MMEAGRRCFMATMLKLPEAREKARETARRAGGALERARNVGRPERGVRLGVGLAAGAAALGVSVPWLRAVFAVASLLGLGTAAVGYCPVNKAMGRDSYHRGA